MKKLILVLSSAAILAFATSLVLAPGRRRPAARMPTLTSLPEFPKLSLSGIGLSNEQKDVARQKLLNHKIGTYPIAPAGTNRVAKFTSTGIFGGFPPTEEQIARIAPFYDDILLGAARKDLIPRFKKYNSRLTFFLYVDSGLNPGFSQSDAGGVDEEDLDWVLEHHSDWILKDQDGDFIRSGNSRLGNRGEFWPDPGNPGWQRYFAEKVTKLVQDTGKQWTGILLDQFMGTADGYERYAGAGKQIRYPTDSAFQEAQIQFLKAVAAKIQLPIIVNMEGASIIRRPAFVAEVAQTAGGVENEIFPEEMPIEDMRPYLETVQNFPPEIRVRINSKPSGLAGNIDQTLFAYFSYLLIADRNRNVYWTYKEGTSDVPHYWYREFELDLGNPKGTIHFGESVWSRTFDNAIVVVNAGKSSGEFRWNPAIPYWDVNGRPLNSPLSLKSRTALLLISEPSILPSRPVQSNPATRLK